MNKCDCESEREKLRKGIENFENTAIDEQEADHILTINFTDGAKIKLTISPLGKYLECITCPNNSSMEYYTPAQAVEKISYHLAAWHNKEETISR